ncbi:hypothetical protein ACPEEZ_03475 [Frigoribacterium sp. 2-23]|uniref:hypothetical protein n=1 Tax=Frigoribacterium sp. 2-23 TaxID=3415006 RepID=UPI003C6F920E
MNIESWGGGIVLALVAVLWLVYLVPTWHKRQEYLATERNAVRLQQTLRILAQTAELPEEVRVEANAKSVADAQRILRTEQARREALRRAHEAARQRAITRELAAAGPVLRAADRDPALAARRLRRSRLVSTLVLVAGVVAVVFGLINLATAWMVAVAGAVFGAGAVAMLAQLAAVARARARRLAAAPAAPVEAQPLRDFSGVMGEGVRIEDDVEVSREWTPVSVPQPLYLRQRASAAQNAQQAALVSAQRAAQQHDLRRQALKQAQHDALREAARAEAALHTTREPAAAVRPVVRAVPEPAAPVTAAPVAPAPPAVPSRFASMGIIDDLGPSTFELDEALRRRRAV